MKKNEFRDILKQHLLPMFSGTTLGKFHSATKRQKLVATIKKLGPCALLLKPAMDSDFKIELSRSQPFDGTERRLVEHFISECETVLKVDQEFRDDLLNTIPRKVISELLFHLSPSTLEASIRHFEEFASQTYEGHPIVSAIGITGSNNYGKVPMDKLFDEDFSRVLANGVDSLFVCDQNGMIFNVAYLPPGEKSVLAPFRLAPIASWSKQNRNVALVLNRNGELLLFKDGKLQFAKRKGRWGYFPHGAMIKRLGRGDKSLRKAIYESCIDISFGRMGGCIAWLDANKNSRISPEYVNKSDLLLSKTKEKTKLLFKTINKKFHRLDRRLRQEMLAMDGATILSHSGEVLATGAIVKVPSGSSGGGGRRAAAIALSRFGVGIKISSDGPVEAFRDGNELFSI